MRLSELQRYRAVDVAGRPLDHIKDVRLEQQGEEWVVTDLIVGRAAFAERLGFIHGVVERPVLLARLMRWVARHARVVPWEDVRLEQDRVVVASQRGELLRPEGK